MFLCVLAGKETKDHDTRQRLYLPRTLENIQASCPQLQNPAPTWGLLGCPIIKVDESPASLQLFFGEISEYRGPADRTPSKVCLPEAAITSFDTSN